MKKQLQLVLLLILCLTFFEGQAQRVGDPGVTVDASKFDSDYPQMARWAKAGVRGGIPKINSFDKVNTITPGNSDKINQAITNMKNSLSSGQKGLVKLSAGKYTINKTINMKSNVSLQGLDRNGVVCEITMTNSDAFYFFNVVKSGIYNLTIRGGWPEAKYLWNYGPDVNNDEAPGNSNVSVRLKGAADCWLDNVRILNSAKDPLRCPSEHITFRDLIVDGCLRKSGQAQGYFFIQGRDNLITGCQITHLRHISLQGGNVEYNVVYDNDFRQEVSFHSGDAGNNLIANNRITLPSDMPPLSSSDPAQRYNGRALEETKTGKPIYFGVMGPWSNSHQNSAKPNFLYKNKIVQDNHNHGSRTPWSDDSKVYTGPKKIAIATVDRINNFPVSSKGVPSGRTLYAVNLGGGSNVNVTGVSVSPTSFSLNVGGTRNLSATVSPNNASDKSITWSSNRSAVATVNSSGRVTAVSAGTATITARTNNGNKTATSSVTVSGSTPPPSGGNIVHIRKRNANGFALDGGNGGANNQNVKLWAQDINNVNQQWEEISRGNGFFSYKKRNTNLCLDGGAGGSNGQNVKINTCKSGRKNQHWKKISTGNGHFRLQKRNASGFSIDGGNGGSNAQNVKLWKSNGTNQNQQWKFTTVATSTALTTRIEVLQDRVSQTADIFAYPNPFGTNTNLVLTKNHGFDNVMLYDLNGKSIFSRRLDNEHGELPLELEGLNLDKGMYILKLTGKGEPKSIKLIKE
ncbi:Ig-like domain-containing protein [Maribacter sp. 2308TA10-17]|uniref:Ig-like domain-containing protein n=1 Tax=Maribacter sp. 2308TA10-17 TaxID=3386276 RepID=UPI0039BC3759